MEMHARQLAVQACLHHVGLQVMVKHCTALGSTAYCCATGGVRGSVSVQPAS